MMLQSTVDESNSRVPGMRETGVLFVLGASLTKHSTFRKKKRERVGACESGKASSFGGPITPAQSQGRNSYAVLCLASPVAGRDTRPQQTSHA